MAQNLLYLFAICQYMAFFPERDTKSSLFLTRETLCKINQISNQCHNGNLLNAITQPLALIS